MYISICILLIAVLTATKPLSATYQTINCSPSNLTFDIDSTHKVNIKNPSVLFKYYRDNLAVYQYPGTPSVNLYLNDTKISIKGDIDNNDFGLSINNDKLLSTQVLGLANVDNFFEDCAFFVLDKKIDSFADALPHELESIVFQLVEDCLSTKLCLSLSEMQNNDLTRARDSPRDFGPLSIWSRTIHISYPKMIPPHLQKNGHTTNKPINLVEASDSIIRKVAEIFYYERNGGTIKIPDLKQGVFSASKGTFTGMQNLVRDRNIQVRASSPKNSRQMFSFTFEISKGHVEYKTYKSFRFVPILGSLCADVQNILFTATIQMDFTKKSCYSNLVEFSTKDSGTAKSYTCGRLSMFTNPFMKWFVNAWDTKVVQVIELEIEGLMAAYIYDKFDCEHFRPEKKQFS